MRLDFYFLWSTTIYFLLATFYSRAHAQALENSGCELGFQRIVVNETIVRNEFDDFSVKITSPFDTNYSNYVQTYKLNENVVRNIELCVPADLCLVIEIDQSWSGSNFVGSAKVWHETQGAIELKGPYYKDFQTTLLVGEMGNCDLACDENEAFLELDFFIEQGYVGYDWRIQDSFTNEAVVQCDRTDMWSLCSKAQSEQIQFRSEKHCIPREGCYSLLAAGTVDDGQLGYGMINLTLDGERFSNLSHANFQYLEFGDTACPKFDCSREESLLELFLHRPLPEAYESSLDFPDLSWTLDAWDRNDILLERRRSILAEGIIAKNPTAETLLYHRQCVDASFECSELALAMSPEEVDVLSFESFSENGSYKLALNGVNYGTSRFRLSQDPLDSKLRTVVHAGEQCRASDICGEYDSLLEIQFETKAWSLEWSPFAVNWELFYVFADETTVRPDVSTNQVYRHLTCFSFDYYDCAVLGMKRAAIDSFENAPLSPYYRVWVDGVESLEREYCEDVRTGKLCPIIGSEYIGTWIGGDCSVDYHGSDDETGGSFSGPGIFVFGVLLLSLLLVVHHRKRQLQRSRHISDSNAADQAVAIEVVEVGVAGPMHTTKAQSEQSNGESTEDNDEDSHC